MIPFAMNFTLRRYHSINTFLDFFNIAFSFTIVWIAHFIIFALFAGPYQSVFERTPYTPIRRILAFLIAISLSALVFSYYKL